MKGSSTGPSLGPPCFAASLKAPLAAAGDCDLSNLCSAEQQCLQGKKKSPLTAIYDTREIVLGPSSAHCFKRFILRAMAKVGTHVNVNLAQRARSTPPPSSVRWHRLQTPRLPLHQVDQSCAMSQCLQVMVPRLLETQVRTVSQWTQCHLVSTQCCLRQQVSRSQLRTTYLFQRLQRDAPCPWATLPDHPRVRWHRPCASALQRKPLNGHTAPCATRRTWISQIPP